MAKQNETIVEDPNTGGKKGSKLAKYELIPSGPLWLLAEHYGKGMEKYAARNWEKGYAWSLGLGAAKRHLDQFWLGEAVDPETGSLHTVAAAWHCFGLTEFQVMNLGTDDRPHPGVWLPWSEDEDH